jgi:hypothetical protein
VAETLGRLAARAQVVTITHLPQIASVAERHFRVEKVPGDPTHTRIEQLDDARAERDRAYARRPRVPRDPAMSSRNGSNGSVDLTGLRASDRRTKNLVAPARPERHRDHRPHRPRPGRAEELIESGVRVVVNVAPSQTAAYPNPGPLLLVRGGVRLIDVPGATLRAGARRRAGDRPRGRSLRNGTLPRDGRLLEEPSWSHACVEQRGRVTDALEAFADNTMRYLREEGRLLAEGIDFPPLHTSFRDRHALVVARGPGYKRDLADGQAVHPRLQAGARRGGRRRRRAARGGYRPT